MKYRRLFPLLFALLLTVGALTLSAAAEGTDEIQTFVRINPMYADLITEDDLVKPVPVVFGGTKTYDTVEEAADYLAEQMMARSETINVPLGDDVDVGFAELFDAAVAHTGEPAAGDYLLWHWGGYSGSISGRTYTYYMLYYTTAEQEELMDAAVDELLATLNLYNASDYAKICGIYDYMTNYITYDYNSSGMLKHTAYAALINGTSVCQGYASLFYRLALELGVENRIVAGIGNGGNHGWNIVKLGSKYYSVDATWDATWAQAGYDYRYFMRCDANFGDHTRTAVASNGDPWRYAYDSAEFLTEHPISSTDYSPAATTLTVTRQPSSATVTQGSTVNFVTAASGSGLSYQWQYRTSSAGTWKNSGATGNKTATLKVTTNANHNGYQYRCVITDSTGDRVYTTAANLKVTAGGVSITSQPTRVYIKAGNTAKFTVTASGSNLSYQWQYSTNGGGTWANATATGNKTATLSVPATTGRNGYKYRCVVTNGSSTATSNAATLYVTGFATQPKSVTTAEGNTAKFTVKVTTGGTLTYQWQYRTSASGTWKNATATGNKTATLKVPATASRDGYQYRCKVTDSMVGAIYSKAVTLTVKTELAITGHPANVTAPEGSKASFTVKATGTGLTYRWQYRTSSTGTWKATYADGYKTNVLYIPATMDRDGYQYRCKITDASGAIVYSGAATLNVYQALEITHHPQSVQAMVGESVYFDVEAYGEDITFKWQYKAPGGTWKATTATGYKTEALLIPATLSRNGYQYRCILTDGSGNTVTSNAATLTVINGVRIISSTRAVTVEEGQNAYFNVEATGDGLTYKWQYKAPGGTWKATTATGYKTATLTIPGTLGRDGYQYRCIITDAYDNTVTSDPATLTVNAAEPGLEITLQPWDQAVEVGTVVYFSVEINEEGADFQWQYRASASGTWKNSGATGNQTSVLRVVTNAKHDGYQYRCIVTGADGDKVISDAATLSIVEYVKVVGHPTDATASEDEVVWFSVAVSGEVGGYRWQYKTPDCAQWSTATPFMDPYSDVLGVYVTADLDGYQFRCFVIGIYGETDTSIAATLTVV